MTIIIWGTVIAAIVTLAVGKHATDRWHIDRAAEEEAAKHPSQLQRNAHRTYPIRPFAAFTTCPGCGTVGCFPWELPPEPTDKDTQDESVEALDYLTGQAISEYNNLRALWGGETFYTTRTVAHDEPPPDATTCDVIRTCPTCGARWGER
ncbi:hypothetical protein [Corynebacterium freneyi]|uniref:Uncharacterized protein n=1 Tax=Corynebacterium freneyi TaxID=134034 RepID=A0ABS4U8S5_9CORY|nr:hypothetical protein [Corynebacterium freneyi]MBP2333057.1 hypothetical protein [Corynebacterium freneyi]QXA52847.1 hypothetical protein I6L56_12705 [Corynebacterium freneyi]WJZ04841.1 hypothetical protein CFREN_04315 [Corynebacterium freneyi]